MPKSAVDARAHALSGKTQQQSFPLAEHLGWANQAQPQSLLGTSKQTKMRPQGLLAPPLNQAKSKKQETLDKDAEIYKRYAP